MVLVQPEEPMYDSYSDNNSKSVSLVALFVAFTIAFTAGFGALCFATSAGHSDSTGNPLKQQRTQNAQV